MVLVVEVEEDLVPALAGDKISSLRARDYKYFKKAIDLSLFIIRLEMYSL